MPADQFYFMKYQTLKVGDVRQQGDETRVTYIRYKSLYNDGEGYPYADPWQEVSLVGWPILPSDLFNAEFRRPL